MTMTYVEQRRPAAQVDAECWCVLHRKTREIRDDSDLDAHGGRLDVATLLLGEYPAVHPLARQQGAGQRRQELLRGGLLAASLGWPVSRDEAVNIKRWPISSSISSDINVSSVNSNVLCVINCVKHQ